MVVDTTFYDLLEVSPNASYKELRSAFLRVMSKNHPENNSEGKENLRKIKIAYCTLINPETRPLYDGFGFVTEDLAHRADGTCIYEIVTDKNAEFCENGFKHLKFVVRISLEEAYCGSTQTIGLLRQCVMHRGQRIEYKQLTNYTCCKHEKITIDILMGISSGSKLDYKFDGDDFQPTMLKVHFEDQSHGIYKRVGHNLIMEIKITSVEASIGFEKIFLALDKRRLTIKKEHGDKTQDKEMVIMKGEGFPYYEHGQYRSGDLLIFFRVAIDEQKQRKFWRYLNELTDEQKQELIAELNAAIPSPTELEYNKYYEN